MTAPAPRNGLQGAPANIELGYTARDQAFPRSLYCDADGKIHQDLDPRELVAALASGVGDLWVDVDSTNRHQHAVLEKIFHFHPLAIEDTLNPASRVKQEEYDGYLFAIVRGVRFEDETDDPYDIKTYNQYFFLGKNYLVTVHAEPSPSIIEVAHRLERTPDLLLRHPSRIMHAIMDAQVDAYFPILDQIDEFVDGLEERVFASFEEGALRDIFAVKRLVLGLRRHLTPQRDVFNVFANRPMALLPPETQVYFRDVYDHVLRINDSLDTYRELLSSTLDSYLSQISNRLGKITLGLSVVATMSIPFVVISGMWGMNFEHIPFSGVHNGFWWMLALQLGLGVALVYGLRKWRLM
ncbi:MAG: magnesium transporter CorA family protein [Gemmatimonadaceae bacterium]|nr:magnesium transporter CorA family protein [Gemmatimonadaceae bacterium]